MIKLLRLTPITVSKSKTHPIFVRSMETAIYNLPTPPISVIITGATGTLGSEVVRECCNDPRFDRVTLLVRRNPTFQHPKLNVVVHSDFTNYSAIQEKLANHTACYWCLGVSSLDVKTEEEYRNITVNYAVNAAKAMIAVNPNFSFHFVSSTSVDTTKKQRLMYPRVKGEAEIELAKIGIPQLVIWRPGWIKPLHYKDKASIGFKVNSSILSGIYALWPSLGTDGHEISKAFFYATFNPIEKNVILNFTKETFF